MSHILCTARISVCRVILSITVYSLDTYRCKMTELKALTEWAAHGSSGSEDETDARLHTPASTNLISASTRTSDLIQPTQGLQIALSESWIECRGHETCSFTHDRYRDAVEIELQSTPAESVAKMSLKVLILSCACLQLTWVLDYHDAA